MRRVIVVLAAVLVVATGASAAPHIDYRITVAAGKSETIRGAVGRGMNPDYFGYFSNDLAGICSKHPAAYCETALLRFENPVPADDADGRLTRDVSILLTPQVTGLDFDLVAFTSDAAGTEGEKIDQAGSLPVIEFPESREQLAFSVTTTRSQPAVYVLLHIVYQMTVGAHTTVVSF